ncbi:uncharacterized protein LOC144909506 [Branchiostoma floridae x Branchiostoma belcheri]
MRIFILPNYVLSYMQMVIHHGALLLFFVYFFGFVFFCTRHILMFPKLTFICIITGGHINQGHHNAGAWTATNDDQDEENDEEDNPANHTFNNQRSEGEPENHTCDNRPLEDPENHTYNNEEDFPENRPDNQTSEAIEEEHTYEKGPDETEVLKPYRCQQDRVERMIPNRLYEQSTQHEASGRRDSVEDDNNDDDSERRSFLARLQHVVKNSRVLLVFTTVLITTIVVTAVFLAIISTFPPKATQSQSSSPSSFSGFITSSTVAMESVTSMAPSTVAMDPVKSMMPSTVAMDPITSMAPSTVAMDPVTSMAPSTVAMDPVKSMVCSTVTMAMDVVTSTTQPDCASAWLAGYKTSGVYTIKPWDGERPLKVLCDMDTAGGGWTVLQRRFDGSVSFDKSWRDYRDGFGDVRGEFWLGLEAIHQIVSRETHDLRVKLGDWEGKEAFELYSQFSVSNESDGYRLGLREYSGTAGDGFGLGQVYTMFDSPETPLDYHIGHTFKVSNTGQRWWFGNHGFTLSNLNGVYMNATALNHKVATSISVHWSPWTVYNLKSACMMVRPATFPSKQAPGRDL